MTGDLPAGWPGQIQAPGSPDFETSAVAWLLDLVPPDYRQHSVLRSHPLALATLARHHVRACLDGARQGYWTARTDLGRLLEPPTIDGMLAAYRAEGTRLTAAARGIDLLIPVLRRRELRRTPGTGLP